MEKPSDTILTKLFMRAKLDESNCFLAVAKHFFSRS